MMSHIAAKGFDNEYAARNTVLKTYVRAPYNVWKCTDQWVSAEDSIRSENFSLTVMYHCTIEEDLCGWNLCSKYRDQ